MSGNNMTKEDASRIQSSQANGGKEISSSGFAARAQAAGDRFNNTGGTAANQGTRDAGNSGGSEKAGINK